MDVWKKNSLVQSWCFTQIKPEKFQYAWGIDNFQLVDVIDLKELQSAIFTTGSGLDKLQWRIKLRFDEHIGRSLLLELLTCSEAKIPAKFSFTNMDFFRGDGCPSRSMTATFTKGSTTHGFYDFNYFSATETTPHVTILLDLLYVGNPVLESGQDVHFEIPKDRLSTDLGSLLENHDHSDVIFSISDEEFKAHKAIVSARSPVFDAMFNNDMSESKSNKVVINDIDKEVFREFLKYIYTDKSDKLQQMATDLLGVADKYEVNGLKLMCINELHKGLTTDNAAEVLALAELYSLTELKTRAIKFINNHSADIADTIGFKNLAISNPHLMVDIFRARKID